MTETTPPQAPEQPAPQDHPPGWNTDNLRDYRRLRRSRADRKIAGVAGGLGRHLDVDPTVLRVLFVVLAFFGGAGLLLYGVIWLLVPDDDSTAVVRTNENIRNAIIIGALVVAALLAVGDTVDGYGFPWPLALVGLVVAAVLMSRDSRRRGSPPAPPQPGAVEQEGIAWTPADPPAAGRPRRQGPLLFGTTLALLALALGALGLYDALGGAVSDAAYPAAAVAIIGLMLVVGSVFGRPGGLIALGLVAVVALVSTAIGEPGFNGERDQVLRPTTSAGVLDSYRVPAGHIELDLTGVRDLSRLDGRTVHVSANAGQLVVRVPAGVDVSYDARVDFGGEVIAFDRTDDGWSPQLSGEHHTSGSPDAAPAIELDLDLNFGQIQVVQS